MSNISIIKNSDDNTVAVVNLDEIDYPLAFTFDQLAATLDYIVGEAPEAFTEELQSIKVAAMVLRALSFSTEDKINGVYDHDQAEAEAAPAQAESGV